MPVDKGASTAERFVVQVRFWCKVAKYGETKTFDGVVDGKIYAQNGFRLFRRKAVLCIFLCFCMLK